MIQRVDYWRGFTGGFLAGVAVGALIYFSQDLTKKIAEADEEDVRTLIEREHPVEQSAEPSFAALSPAEINKENFELPSQRPA